MRLTVLSAAVFLDLGYIQGVFFIDYLSLEPGVLCKWLVSCCKARESEPVKMAKPRAEGCVMFVTVSIIWSFYPSL
jgi:hypothetical protein